MGHPAKAALGLWIPSTRTAPVPAIQPERTKSFWPSVVSRRLRWTWPQVSEGSRRRPLHGARCTGPCQSWGRDSN